MKTIKYRGEYYTPEVVKSDDLNYDDAVCINGVKGYVDFIGADILCVVDESDKIHKFKYTDIGKILRLYAFKILGVLTYYDGRQVCRLFK